MEIIINDWQYLITEGLITEEKYQDVIKKLRVGDKLEYTDDSNKTLTFEVIRNDSGQVYLKNLDNGVYKNNYFFITVSDLSKDDLTFKTINVPKNLPDEFKSETKDNVKLFELLKLFPINNWKNSTFKNISKLNMGDEDIDIEKPDAEDEKFKDYRQVDDIDGFLDELRTLKAGNVYKITLSNGGTIDLDLIKNEKDSLFFEYNSAEGPAKSYGELINSELILNIDSKSVEHRISSKTDDENVESVYNIIFEKIIDDGGNRSYKKILIKNIVDIEKSNLSDKEDVEELDISDEEIDDMDVDDLTNLVLNNPTFKNTFLSKPGFLERLLGGGPKGILRAKEILKDIKNGDSEDDKDENSFINLFKDKQEYKIQLSEKSFNRDDVELDMMKKYSVKAIKRTNANGSKIILLSGKINGKVFKFKINQPTENKDEYRATLIINDGADDEYTENRTIKVTDY